VLNAALIERLVERDGGRILSADGAGNGEGPEAALMRNIVSAFAAYERMIIAARTKAALAVKKARGERVGGVPYGWRVGEGGRLEADERETLALQRARELRAGGASLRGVAVTLKAEGHRPRNGGAWAIQTIRRITASG
jgi:site-specific DNA recombinase